MTAVAKTASFAPASTVQRVERYDWSAISSDLNASGCAVMPKLLSPDECASIAALYAHEEHFRSHIYMARHGFGKGEYRYFKYHLPELIGELRTALYSHAATVANAWNERMNIATRYPACHADYLKICHDAGQNRPTPLLLNISPVISTACIRTSTAISHFPCRSPSCCQRRTKISPAVNLS
jgi:uncharacterized protein